MYRKEMIQGIMNSVSRILKKYVAVENENSIDAKLFYMSFLVNWTNNYLFAWELYKKIKAHYLSSLARYILYYHMQKLRDIEKEIAHRRNKSSEIEPVEILVKLKLEKRLQSLFENVGTEYGKFWDILQIKNPRYERFIGIGSNIINLNKRIRSLWEKLCKIRGTISLSVTRMYSLYCQEILMDKSSITKLKEMLETNKDGISSLDSHIRKMQFEGVSDGVVAISATQKSFGKVTLINNTACSIIGCSKESIKDRPFSKVIPQIYRKAHEEAFEIECLKIEGSMKFNREVREAFIKTYSGYILPVDLAIVDGPSLLSQYSFIGKLRLRKHESKHNVIHILTDTDMIIKEISSSIFINK